MSSQVGALFGAAKDDGVLSPGTLKMLDTEDLGAQIQQGLGVVPDDIQASELVINMTIMDDSGSMVPNTQFACDGHNLLIDSLMATKQKDGIITSCRYLNAGLLYPFSRLDQAIRMTPSNYRPYGGTPLFDQSILGLGSVVAKTQEFADAGIPARSVSSIITDGGDTGRAGRVKDVRALIEDMLRAENHIIIGMGIDDGVTDFRAVFKEMGIQDQWILTPKNNPSEIRRAFAMVSQSAVRASQGAAAFSKTAMGGFGA
jgi:hypothetical protein